MEKGGRLSDGDERRTRCPGTSGAPWPIATPGLLASTASAEAESRRGCLLGGCKHVTRDRSILASTLFISP